VVAEYSDLRRTAVLQQNLRGKTARPLLGLEQLPRKKAPTAPAALPKRPLLSAQKTFFSRAAAKASSKRETQCNPRVGGAEASFSQVYIRISSQKKRMFSVDPPKPVDRSHVRVRRWAQAWLDSRQDLRTLMVREVACNQVYSVLYLCLSTPLTSAYVAPLCSRIVCLSRLLSHS
jgi:hypothetical protein